MKRLVLFVAILMVSGFVFADVNFDALKAAHINAMKYYGRADVAEGQMVFVAIGKEMASVYFGNELSTGYVEKNDQKFYWEITPIEGGVKVYIKVNILGKIYEKPSSSNSQTKKLRSKAKEPMTDMTGFASSNVLVAPLSNASIA